MELDFSNAVQISPSSAGYINYTTTKTGAIIVHTQITASSGAGTVLVNGTPVARLQNTTNVNNTDNFVLYNIPKGATITTDTQIQAHATGKYAYFIPYK